MGSADTQHSENAISMGSGHYLYPTPVYETYWRFAHARQELFFERLRNSTPPWTTDRVLSEHRFTNVYRASDRVSQYLIRNVIYNGSADVDEVFFRVLLFKIFNKIETWEALREAVGELTYETYNFEEYAAFFDKAWGRGNTLYSAAYIMPSPPFRNKRKHRNHLRLLELMMRQNAPSRVATASTMNEAFEILKSFPSLGSFLAFQFVIDLNYSEILNFSEMDFVVAGPGALSGIHKCFRNAQAFEPSEIIKAVTDRAQHEFDRLGLPFRSLWGRSLQLIDCQNLFCELDKYSRVVHPEIAGRAGRTRIKQKFKAKGGLSGQWYPPKWALNPTVNAH